MVILDEFKEKFSDSSQYINISTEEEGLQLFEIYYNTYGIRPGPVMSKEYMRYHWAHKTSRTIEGTSSRPRNFIEFEDFVAEYCTNPIKVDFDSISSLL